MIFALLRHHFKPRYAGPKMSPNQAKNIFIPANINPNCYTECHTVGPTFYVANLYFQDTTIKKQLKETVNSSTAIFRQTFSAAFNRY